MYKIVIINERYKYLKWVQTFILIINCIALAAIGYLKDDFLLTGWSSVIALSIILIWAEKKINKSGILKKTDFALTGLIWTLFGWIFSGNWIMAAIIVLLLVLQFSLKRKFEIIFSDSEIHIPLFMKKNYSWYELQNVVLKDGLLTIDFKNNRLLQNEILHEESGFLAEEDFNAFCRTQLNMRYN